MVYIDNLFTKVKRTHGTYNENGDYYKFWFYVFSLWFPIKKDPQETVSLTTYLLRIVQYVWVPWSDLS